MPHRYNILPPTGDDALQGRARLPASQPQNSGARRATREHTRPSLFRGAGTL